MFTSEDFQFNLAIRLSFQLFNSTRVLNCYKEVDSSQKIIKIGILQKSINTKLLIC